MKYFFLTAWLSGLRSRSFHGIFITGVLLVFVAYLAASFSPRQPQTVALDVGLSSIRVILTMLTVFWVTDQIGREIDRKTIILSLSYPVGRASFIIGRFLGIAVLMVVALVIFALLLWIAVFFSGKGYEAAHKVVLDYPYWMAITGIYLDCLMVLAFTICIACVSTVLMLPLVLGVCFAIAGRSVGAVMEYVFTRGAEGDSVVVDNFGPVLNILHWILPDMSRLDWREWPLYGLSPGLDQVAIASFMVIGFLTAVLSLSIAVFGKRNFS